ncbi:putative elongation factor P [Toxoplasma gondii RUB]|uniref:Putative elongation factor P n=5 Tax=Toxoplasma gondii TaxID=5811 RepID=A0A086LM78_TOXGO|nr:putative elongation factor P [Toxoplasma gondii GAB2-2007-GAL-DOM2]KFG55658.1 putative elongation factor P [Toxoplasma gondii FOU]KFG57746.1 putative elongation factor P [Toxoplasma gondii RUB]KFH10089.1 putative elongation factor P [Toxoplasma gondii VAND]PUA92057.1 putative elongation factor P [Toxoplasma gondii TgCATBr9]
MAAAPVSSIFPVSRLPQTRQVLSGMLPLPGKCSALPSPLSPLSPLSLASSFPLGRLRRDTSGGNACRPAEGPLHVRPESIGCFARKTPCPTFPHSQQARLFATVGVGDIRQGHIVVIDGKTVEVTEWRQIKSGRGAASIGISYIDLATFKAGEANFSVNKKLEAIQPEKKTFQVMYVDEENDAVVLADENFDEAEFPLKLFGGSSVIPFLKPELKVVASLHDGLPIKISLPPAVVQQLKSKK